MQNRYMLSVTLCVLLTSGRLYSQEEKKSDSPKAAAKQGDEKNKAGELKTTRERFSYAIGVNIGRQLSQDGLEIDPETLARAIADVMADRELLLDGDQLQQAFVDSRAEKPKKLKELATKNRTVGEKFLAENKKKPGVKVTASGLQYVVVKEGTGATPKRSDSVLAHYQGTLIDGTRFDGSYKGKQPQEGDKPVSFPVTRVIPGWTEALQLMKVGAKWRLFIHPDLAYRDQQRGRIIQPGSVLVFDIELVGIE